MRAIDSFIGIAFWVCTFYFLFRWIRSRRGGKSHSKGDSQKIIVNIHEAESRFENKDEGLQRVRARLWIKYRDGTDQETERIVEVLRFDPNDRDALLTCYCELRNAVRNFYINRIVECVDTETGEVVEDVHSFLKEKARRLAG